MIKQIETIVGKENLKVNYPLSRCCSFGIGGEACFYTTPDSLNDLFNLIEYAEVNNIRYKIIGNGTNILFGDDEFKGIIIATKKLNSTQLVGPRNILVSAGVSLTSVINIARDNNLSGLEFAVGIPGSVGGAIVMNAGANGSEISAIIKSVTVLENGDIRTIEKESLEFGYRTSYFRTRPSSVILFAELELIEESDNYVITERMQDYLNRRLSSQPRDKSAGCVFKKCEEIPAGLLIDNAGLKGMRVGDAEVSCVHANFIINKENAKAEDVKKLIEKIQTVVFHKFNKKLELEIEIIE